MSDLVVFQSDNGQCLIETDYVMLSKLVVQTAANIIETCSKEKPWLGNRYPIHGAASIVAKRMNWAPHGYVNSLQSQVELVYETAKICLKDNTGFAMISFGQDELKLMADALTAYQDWKERLCKEDEEIHGVGFGAGTPFVQKNWADLNERLAGLCSRK